ncbi:MAG TPA: helix-turn-helix transcriptional regulator [Acidobacteriota bacterium]|nr:helix-turn-helix transcriptional regulator [Acidobacteriota bacterium]
MLLHDESSVYGDFEKRKGRFRNLRHLLKSKFPGLSQRKIALKLGVDNATVARWMSAREVQPTSMEKCLRIARACRVDPREIFAMVGLLDEFGPLWDYYHGRIPTILEFYPSEPQRGQLMERADQLLRRGWERRFQAKLKELESYWEVNRGAFESLVQSLEVEAAFLLMKHPGSESDVLYRYKCTSQQARRAGSSDLSSWDHFEHEKGNLSLVLHLKSPAHLESTVIEVILAGWHASFRALFSAD